MSKTGIVILSDAQNGGDEALGRVLNALVLALDLKNRSQEVAIFFQGAGTRSVNILEQSSHPGHGLYKEVKGLIKGASQACSVVFNADIKTIPTLCEFEIPGIGGATSLASALEDGYTLLTF